MITQKTYQPTPYRDSQWEVLGERIKDTRFAPLSLSVIETQQNEPDPMFDVFDEGKRYRPQPQTMLEEVEATPVVQGVDPEEHAAQVAESFEQGRLQGIEEGRALAMEESAAEQARLRDELINLGRAVSTQSKNTFAKVEKQAVQLALSVAKKILVTTADVKPDYIFTVIREGLKCLGAAKPMRIRISPQDFDFLEVIGLPAELSTEELGVQYVPDESIKSGCVIETNFGVIDLELENMWEQVKEQLYEVYR